LAHRAQALKKICAIDAVPVPTDAVIGFRLTLDNPDVLHVVVPGHFGLGQQLLLIAVYVARHARQSNLPCFPLSI
jgi:hypothetical protein